MHPTLDQKIIDRIFPNFDPSLQTLLKNRLDAFYEGIEKKQIEIALDVIQTPAFIKVMLFSEYVAVTLSQDPILYQTLVTSGDLARTYCHPAYPDRLEGAMARGKLDMAFVKETLLQFKLYESIRIAWRDLTGTAALEETLLDLSNLAESCVQYGVDFLYDELCSRFGIPVDAEGKPQQLIVLGMGKLGARELNFSSDIDLMFVYPREGVTTGDTPVSNDEFYPALPGVFKVVHHEGRHQFFSGGHPAETLWGQRSPGHECWGL